MPDHDKDATPSDEKAPHDARQQPNPATQAEMMAFLHAPVMTHRDRRPAPAAKKAPPKRSR